MFPLRILTFLLVTAGLMAAAEPDKNDPKPEKPETHDPITREASVVINGEEIDYKVTAAKLVLKSDDGKPRASVFHVAYERTKVESPTKRPVIFVFNGGPGSSAVWLHLGALGPRRVPTTPDGLQPLPPPRAVIDNPHSILDVADLVFIDPVSTGYSRPEKDTKASEFHGLEGDIRSVSDFIRRWVSTHDRWASPKYLLGESYGGMRAAGVAQHLQRSYGMTLNGVVLLSAVLDFRTLRSAQGDDLTYAVHLPTYTATAHYHGKLRGDRAKLVEGARKFAMGEYAAALLKGADLEPARRKALAQRLAEFTGLPAPLILDHDLRIDSSLFRKELLRNKGLVLGRFDARVSWPSESRAPGGPAYDPSFSLAFGAFSTAMLDYLTRELGWEEESPYEILSGKVHSWDWGSKNSIVNVTPRLSSAMRNNPELDVLVMCGHTDLATPAAGIEYSIRHLFTLPDDRRREIRFEYYDAGHMFYLNEPDLTKMRKDLRSFLGAPAED